MRLRRTKLLLGISVVIVILSFSGQNAYCLLSEMEGVAGESYTAYTPTQWKQTDQADFALGTATQTSVTASAGNVVLATAPSIVPTVLALAGGGTLLFYSYTVSTNTWTRKADAPAAVSNGGRIISDGQRFAYAFQGGSSAFWRYDASLNTWSVLTSAPGTVSAGSDLMYAAGKIYALQGGSSTAVWIYDVPSDRWSTLALTGTLYAFAAGSSICVAGNYIYALRPTTPYMIRVPVAGGTWSFLTADLTQPTTAPGLGSDMVSTGSDSLTVLFGNGGKTFRTYTISTKAWSNLGNAPNNVNVGGGLTYQPSTAYFALAGGSSTRFWKFTLSSNSWSTMATIPNAVGAGGGLTYIYSTTSQYSVTGNFISSVKDTGKSGRLLNSIFWDETLPSSANQRITVEVRASDTLVGGVPNAAWTLLPSQAPVTGSSTDYSSLSSLSGQYVQYKIEMCTSDVAATPSLSEVRLYYASY